uniref:Reverse transcriptase domain-containing protein n=1 Tax=Strongyloides venezuelensis TaxID=75913 RepID=A0A0K0F044_STRVS
MKVCKNLVLNRYSSCILKYLLALNVLLTVLLQRFNTYIHESFSSLFKKASLILLKKPENLKFTTNTRPISILPGNYKLLMLMILDRMRNRIECLLLSNATPLKAYCYTDQTLLTFSFHTVEISNSRKKEACCNMTNLFILNTLSLMDQYRHIDFKSLDQQDILARTKKHHSDPTKRSRAISTILSEVETNDTTMI